ncbi:MAG: ribonuclease HII [Aminivibrio sp.]|jgi:ribonuclease HII|nr:ribonuclease HII [Aminivibrio sp.]
MDLSRWGRIAGADEAGRGPLAGPVVAAAAVLTPAQEEELLSLGLTDSKKLTPRRREFLFERMLSLNVRWRAQAASPARIDGMNILRASLWAMGRSVEKLPPCFDTVIVDGTFPLPGLTCRQFPLPKADSLVPAAAAASVAAKVLRDRVMEILDGLYPGYGFKQHKGYPTAAHRKALVALGPSPVHRASFTWSAPS